MQNIFSPYRFYVTFQHDDSWNFDKILNVIKKLIFMLLYKYMIFPLFWMNFISFFSKLCKTFFVNREQMYSYNNDNNNN